MSQEGKTAYAPDELKEFEEIILKKLSIAKEELQSLKETLSKKNDSGTDFTASTAKLLEDGADTLERENMNQLAARQQKFIINLENALIRIKNGTYGVCVDTGKLIAKERLKSSTAYHAFYRGKIGQEISWIFYTSILRR
jgi:DnaK suppressor protein